MSATPDLPMSDPFAPLGHSITEEYHYSPRIEGRLPAGLEGTLLRNGPGLFERAGRRKRHLLDGDGLLQAFRIAGGKVDYQARFVRTEKFKDEERAGHYLYPTWTTRSAKGMLSNSIGRIRTQAGVSVVAKRGRVFAFDDIGLPYEIDSSTLATIGVYQPGDRSGPQNFNAHTRYDSATGDWLLFGQEHGRRYEIKVLILDHQLRRKKFFKIAPPHATYLHDWFATERYVVFNLHALRINPFPGLLGLKAFTECLHWAPERGNHLMVIDKNTGQVVAQGDAPAAFMWHSMNAYEQGDSIVADFVGYDEPDHFIGADPYFERIMRGEPGLFHAPGTLRRYRIQLSSGRVEESIVDGGHFEFPMIDVRRAGRTYRFGYLAEAGQGTGWHDSVARIDMDTGAKSRFTFGEGVQVGEPVVVPHADSDPDTRPQSVWLLSVIFKADTRTSALAVIDGEHIEDGPIATVELDHATPLSFHGTWMGA
ncbi:MAG: carotenoid oxygenase family protein [Gammaproteobacteria bacterium]|nr:carotenoid oxygenase family protein [Gammaproteobacteria bacterium]